MFINVVKRMMPLYTVPALQYGGSEITDYVM